jgi:hypothetical protein
MTPSARSGPTPPPTLLLCLVAAPLVALIARLLSAPWVDDPANFLADISAHPTRSDAGSLLALLAAALLIPAGLTLAAAIRPHKPKLAATGATLTVVGTIALAGVATASLIAGQIARQPQRAAMVDLWDHFHNASIGNVIFLALIAGGVGYILLAIGLYRARVAPLPAAALTGLGGVGIMLTAPGPARPVIIGVAVLALAGFTWVAAAFRPRNDPDHAHRTIPEANTAA